MLQTARDVHIQSHAADASMRSLSDKGEILDSLVHDTSSHDQPEQRLWRAVLTSTVEEWVHGPLRKQREAEHFLLLDNEDYPAVCSSAGIDPSDLRRRLRKLRGNAGTETFGKASEN